jgi:hypothetical protein
MMNINHLSNMTIGGFHHHWNSTLLGISWATGSCPESRPQQPLHLTPAYLLASQWITSAFSLNSDIELATTKSPGEGIMSNIFVCLSEVAHFYIIS